MNISKRMTVTLNVDEAKAELTRLLGKEHGIEDTEVLVESIGDTQAPTMDQKTIDRIVSYCTVDHDTWQALHELQQYTGVSLPRRFYGMLEDIVIHVREDAERRTAESWKERVDELQGHICDYRNQVDEQQKLIETYENQLGVTKI